MRERLTRRPLGPGGPAVPALGLGSWNTWDRMPQDERVAAIFRAVEGGAGFFDVAHYASGPYGASSSDIIFGAALWASGIAREDVVVCGKLWLHDWPRRSFRDQVEASLERVGIERFDAVVVGDYRERPDIRAVVTGVGELVQTGLVGSWGVGNWFARDTLAAVDIAALDGLAPPSFAQLAYSIARRSMAESEPYGELFRAGTLALQASGVLEGGILAGRLRPARRIGAGAGGVRGQIVAAYPAVERLARGIGATPAQLAIAFCLAHEPVRNVLFGVSRVSQLESDLGALRLAAERGAWLRAALGSLQADSAVVVD